MSAQRNILAASRTNRGSQFLESSRSCLCYQAPTNATLAKRKIATKVLRIVVRYAHGKLESTIDVLANLRGYRRRSKRASLTCYMLAFSYVFDERRMR